MLVFNARKDLPGHDMNAFGAFLEDAAPVEPHPTIKEQASMRGNLVTRDDNRPALS